MFEDRAIPVSGQDFMIAAVDGALGGQTSTHMLAARHSPFYSQPPGQHIIGHRRLGGVTTGKCLQTR